VKEQAVIDPRRIAVGLILLLGITSLAGPPAAAVEQWWQPAMDVSWQIQLSGDLDTEIPVDVVDIDLFDTPRATIADLQDDGRRVICYFSAGSYENWRPDKGRFPENALGKPLDGWPGERWLDIRSAAVRRIMLARLDLAADKGCDAVDPDNVDGYANRTGFSLKAADQVRYNQFLAGAAHARGLAVGLKNDVEQIPALVDNFDFAVNEECFRYDECGTLEPFIAASKPVFQIEYVNPARGDAICGEANRLGFQTLIKKLSLLAWRIDWGDR
jgi:hypothetical protein